MAGTVRCDCFVDGDFAEQPNREMEALYGGTYAFWLPHDVLLSIIGSNFYTGDRTGFWFRDS